MVLVPLCLSKPPVRIWRYFSCHTRKRASKNGSTIGSQRVSPLITLRIKKRLNLCGPGVYSKWSRPGSNRRPLACHAAHHPHGGWRQPECGNQLNYKGQNRNWLYPGASRFRLSHPVAPPNEYQRGRVRWGTTIEIGYPSGRSKRRLCRFCSSPSSYGCPLANILTSDGESQPL